MYRSASCEDVGLVLDGVTQVWLMFETLSGVIVIEIKVSNSSGLVTLLLAALRSSGKYILLSLIWNKVRGESKKFVDFVNKIKSTYAISLKLPYVCDQFITNKHRKFQTNRLINVVSMAICLMRVSATRSTPRR